MTVTILQRVHALADKPPDAEACRAVASIARKLASTDDAVTKAHAIAGTLRDLVPETQDAIVRAVEALNAP
ncbi:MAG: hypothetical protein WAT39_01845 [Planctomycetota bacterium]